MTKGDIWLVDLPTGEGHEQQGPRPAILLTNTNTDLAIVIPCTSNIRALRFPYTLEIRPTKNNGLTTISIALIFQIRAIDASRLKKKIGTLEEQDISQINQFLKKLLTL
jgi:mRNA interferase MazF